MTLECFEKQMGGNFPEETTYKQALIMVVDNTGLAGEVANTQTIVRRLIVCDTAHNEDGLSLGYLNTIVKTPKL